MTDRLASMMEAGVLTPLSYYFARFVANHCGVGMDSILARSAALVSDRNLRGDVCVDLAQLAGRPLFEDSGDARTPLLGPDLLTWRQKLAAAPWVAVLGDVPDARSEVSVVPVGWASSICPPGGGNAVEIRNPLPLGEARVRETSRDVSTILSQASAPLALTPTPLPEGEGLDSAALPGGGEHSNAFDTPGSFPLAPLVLEGHRLYLGKFWSYEQQVAGALYRRMSAVDGIDAERLKTGLARLFPGSAPGAVDWQCVAAVIAVSRRFAVLSGGPGTGKTTTVIKVLVLLLEQNPSLRIAMAAPTGKAAMRLTESVGAGKREVHADSAILAKVPREASTIHRLIGLGMDPRPRHHRGNPLMIDCLVVDEASMIDLPLMARLLDALPGTTRLILLGDRDQLASVEAGNVLGDITGHGQPVRYSAEQAKFLQAVGIPISGEQTHEAAISGPADHVGLLHVSYRFQAGSGIGALARAVNAGDGEAALQVLRSADYPDAEWLDARPDGMHGSCLEWAVERYGAYLHEGDVADALALFEQSRVLTALHKGPFGTDDLNRLIEQRLQSKGLIRGGEEYAGKPVMITRNDYEVGLFNGDIGLLWTDESGGLRAWFRVSDGTLRSLSIRQLPERQTAYALTVHKSQGSEFNEVMLVLPHDSSPVLTRELIYTGITRARKRVIVQGGAASFAEGCRKIVRRSSGLAEKLGWPSGS